MLHPGLIPGQLACQGGEGLRLGQGGGEDKEHEANRFFLSLPKQQLSACSSHSCTAPEPLPRRPQEGGLEGGTLGKKVDALLGSYQREGTLPAHPTSAPHILRCPEEPHAEPPLTPRPRASGRKTARLLSPGEHVWKRERVGRCPGPHSLPLFGCVVQEGKQRWVSKSPPHHGQCPQSCPGSWEWEGAWET